MNGIDISDRLAIAALSDGFAHGLDHGDLAGFLAIFTADADYRSGTRHLQGHAQIEAFFRTRAAGGRVSRHLWSGLRLSRLGPDEIAGESLWLTFAGAGPVPVAGTTPFAVADVSDLYHRTAQGWRIARRQITPVFTNPTIAPPVTVPE